MRKGSRGSAEKDGELLRERAKDREPVMKVMMLESTLKQNEGQE